MLDNKGASASPMTGGLSTMIKSNGTLSIAGKENPVEIDSEISAADGTIEIKGSKPLLMTDYGVKPPTVMGLLRTKNEVTIFFDLILKASE